MSALGVIAMVLMCIGGVTMHEFKDADGGVGAFVIGALIFAVGAIFGSIWIYIR